MTLTIKGRKAYRSTDITTLRPSALIRLALADLSAAVKLGYTVDMSEWVRDDLKEGGSSTCTVCLAGAVMVSRCSGILSSRRERLEGWPTVQWGRVSEKVSAVLRALDLFREGYIRSALSHHLGYCWTSYLDAALPVSVTVTPYREDRERFHADLTYMADALESLGY